MHLLWFPMQDNEKNFNYYIYSISYNTLITWEEIIGPPVELYF